MKLRDPTLWEPKEHLCSFGLTEGILGGVLLGAGLGAGEAALSGGNIGLGALTGGITGGLVPVGGEIGGIAGGATGAFAGDVLGGVAGGLIGSGITGGNPLMGALTGAGGGLVAGAFGVGAPQGGSGEVGSAVGGGTSAAGGAPISGVVANPDLTDAVPTSAFASDVGGGTVSGFAGGAPGSTDLGTLVDASGAVGQVAPAANVGTVAAAPIAAAGGGVGFDASGQVIGASPDAAAATVSGGATGVSQTPLSAANIAGGTGAPQSLLDKLIGGAGSSIAKNPLGVAMGVGGLGLDLIKGQKQDPNAKALANQAAALNAQIGQLEAPLTSGQLPPGAQSAVNQGVASAKAAIRAKYASLGLSGSTMEAQDLANVDMQQQTQVFQLASNLFSQGIQGAQLSESIYRDLLGANTQQNAATGQAIANLAGALNGGGGNQLTLKVA